MTQPGPLEPAQLEQIIRDGIPGAEVTVTDLTGTRDHYRVEVVSSAFEGKNRVQQHQMIYAAVGNNREARRALQKALDTGDAFDEREAALALMQEVKR